MADAKLGNGSRQRHNNGDGDNMRRKPVQRRASLLSRGLDALENVYDKYNTANI